MISFCIVNVLGYYIHTLLVFFNILFRSYRCVKNHIICLESHSLYVWKLIYVFGVFKVSFNISHVIMRSAYLFFNVKSAYFLCWGLFLWPAFPFHLMVVC